MNFQNGNLLFQKINDNYNSFHLILSYSRKKMILYISLIKNQNQNEKIIHSYYHDGI